MMVPTSRRPITAPGQGWHKNEQAVSISQPMVSAEFTIMNAICACRVDLAMIALYLQRERFAAAANREVNRAVGDGRRGFDQTTLKQTGTR